MSRANSGFEKGLHMNSDEQWQEALRKAPDDRVPRLAYADWLEEQGRRLEACKQRQQAGAGTLVFSLWHPSWGERRVGEWTQLEHLKSHVNQKHPLGGSPGAYRAFRKDVPVSELVVVIEWRANATEIVRQPYRPEMSL
jgi:uncharacterized protein (TIGR02996 family)